MPTLVVGMLRTPKGHYMPRASVGMAPVSGTFRRPYALPAIVRPPSTGRQTPVM